MFFINIGNISNMIANIQTSEWDNSYFQRATEWKKYQQIDNLIVQSIMTWVKSTMASMRYHLVIVIMTNNDATNENNNNIRQTKIPDKHTTEHIP